MKIIPLSLESRKIAMFQDIISLNGIFLNVSKLESMLRPLPKRTKWNFPLCIPVRVNVVKAFTKMLNVSSAIPDLFIPA